MDQITVRLLDRCYRGVGPRGRRTRRVRLARRRDPRGVHPAAKATRRRTNYVAKSNAFAPKLNASGANVASCSTSAKRTPNSYASPKNTARSSLRSANGGRKGCSRERGGGFEANPTSPRRSRRERSRVSASRPQKKDEVGKSGVGVVRVGDALALVPLGHDEPPDVLGHVVVTKPTR